LEKEKEAIMGLWHSPKLVEVRKIETLSRRILSSFEKGGSLAFFGNGGSAAEANHLAAEFVGKCVINHVPLPAVSFSANTSILTAIANDYGENEVFARQVLAHLGKDSIVVGLSTSGSSKNVLHGLQAAKTLGVYTVLWTSARLRNDLAFVDEIWKVESESTPRIQEVHLLWGHLLAETVEQIIAE
jgi:D-sedoheptulose 7-phosphate isomerase